MTTAYLMRKSKRVIVIALAVVVAGSLCLSLARARALKRTCALRLKRIHIDLLQYHSTHGALPPAKIRDGAGNPILSWRAFACDYTVPGGHCVQHRL